MKNEISKLELLLCITKILDNPFEDISAFYYILNTNTASGTEDDKSMLQEEKAYAFFSAWKHKIEHLQKGDKVSFIDLGKG